MQQSRLLHRRLCVMSDAIHPVFWLRLTPSRWGISGLGSGEWGASCEWLRPEGDRGEPHHSPSCLSTVGENKTRCRVIYFHRTIKSWHKDTATHAHTKAQTHVTETCSLSYPLPFLTRPNQWKPIFEVHIDFLNQTLTKCRHYINLYVWQHYWLGSYEPRSECIRWCQGWIDRQALTHSALLRDHMLTPCQSEREKAINMQD